MSQDDNQVDTPLDVDVVADPSTDPGNSGAANNQPEEPFLKVNDRQTYKTRDEAVRAYDESGKRIAQLSGWEKAAKAYGLEDPKALKPIFDETLTLRERVKELEKLQGKASAQPTHTDADEKLTPEEQKARDYLKSVLPKLGYIAKGDLEQSAQKIQELEAKLEKLEGSSQQSQAQYYSNQEASAREDLTSMLKNDYGDDPNGSRTRIVGTLIKDWINSDDDLVARWSKGGIEAKNLVREGYELFKGELPWQKPTAAADPASAASAAAKGRAVVQNKKLPQQGSSKTDAKGDGAKKVGINRSTHDKAWEVMQRVNAG